MFRWGGSSPNSGTIFSRVNDSSAIVQLRHAGTLVPRAATLDGFVDDVGDARGIHLRELEPLTTVIVQTHNSRYRIVITSGTSAIVQGGKFFTEPTPARIDGSGFGGSVLKTAWIGVGLKMEIFANDQRIITSPVLDVTLERARAVSIH
jgi:hypothetical protein